MEKVTLPREPLPPNKKFPKTMLIYGKTKFGKTRILTQLPDNLIFDLEFGAETYECIRVTPKNYREFSDYAEALTASEHKYQFVTIDTIDRMVEWLEDQVAKGWNEKQKKVKEHYYVTSYSEIPYGQGYDLVRKKMRSWINFFRRNCKHLILVGHLKRTLIATDTSITLDEANLDLVGKLRNLIFADMDLIALAFRKGNQLKLSFKHSDVTGGGRFPKLDDKVVVISEKNEDNTIKTFWDQIFEINGNTHKSDKLDVPPRGGNLGMSEADKGGISGQNSQNKTD